VEDDVGSALKLYIALCVLAVTGGNALAQTADISPVLLIESTQSNDPEYRRMVSVSYLSGNRITANYLAYNRRQFISVPSRHSAAQISACTQGAATSLKDIRAFQKDEARWALRGTTPETRLFCIKNIPNWKAQNKDLYLDPIFEGMPYVKGKS
jgi:hypothetical protein